MADTKISQLPYVSLSGLTNSDIFPLVNSGDTKQTELLDIKNFVLTGVDNDFVTGGSYNSLTESLDFSGTSGFSPFSVDVSQLLDDTNSFTTGATFSNNIIYFDRNDVLSAYTVDLSSINFTGNTSGNCISDLYVTNLNSCSPLHIQPTNSGNVYIGESGGVNVGIGTITPTSKVDISGSTGYSQLRVRTDYTPSSSGDTNGEIGNFSWDDDFLYMKTNNGWGRIPLDFSFTPSGLLSYDITLNKTQINDLHTTAFVVTPGSLGLSDGFGAKIHRELTTITYFPDSEPFVGSGVLRLRTDTGAYIINQINNNELFMNAEITHCMISSEAYRIAANSGVYLDSSSAISDGGANSFIKVRIFYEIIPIPA
jgi:hypothetical protein